MHLSNPMRVWEDSFRVRKTGKPGGNGSVDLKAAWLVGGGGPELPTVKLTEPAAGATFAAPARIKLTAEAAANQGSITKVEFFAGTNLIAAATASPYTFTWDNVPAGRYSFMAKATDSAGASALSASVSVPVTVGSGGSLQGAYTDTARYDLTALGTGDWAHWGRAGELTFDHKRTGWGQISDVTLVGTGHSGQSPCGHLGRRHPHRKHLCRRGLLLYGSSAEWLVVYRPRGYHPAQAPLR